MNAALIYSETLQQYDFGPGHPFRSDRYTNFMKLFREQATANRQFDLIEPTPASAGDLQLVHRPEYIEFIQTAIAQTWPPRAVTYVDPDTPLSPGMDEAARTLVGSGILAGELVASGRYKVAVSVGGGMHHARPSRGAGFCIYNDVAICVRNLMKKHSTERILILDTDGHAGDGTSEIFYDDPHVLFISLHQDPFTQYPGRGFPNETGQGEGEGFTVNLPLPPRTAIRPYLHALDEIFVPLAHEFKPEVILRNGGSDPHFDDQLVMLGITVAGFQQIGNKVREVAGAVCDGRIVDMVGSGYNPRVLPYAWLALISGVAGVVVEVTEPSPPPAWLNDELGMVEVKSVVEEVKGYLAPFWRCF